MQMYSWSTYMLTSDGGEIMAETKFTTKTPPKSKIAKAPSRRERITDVSTGASGKAVLVPKRTPVKKSK